jgi:hypothetical protein
MCSLRFENKFLSIECVCFASIVKKTLFSKLPFVRFRFDIVAITTAVRWCRWWDSQVEFRIVLKHLWKYFFTNPRCTFIRAYNVDCNTYILAPVFIYFLLDSGGGKGSYKALAASPQLEDSESLSCYSAQEEWQQKSVPASGVFFLTKPDSTAKTNQK